jgi:ribosome-associated protein
MPVRINDRLTIPDAELVWRFGPSGGPGGQHANTANTRAEVVFEIATSEVLSEGQRSALERQFGPRIRVAADDTRSQARNREIALERLAERAETALRPRRKRTATKPGRGAKERRLRAKRERSQRKAERRYRGDQD